MGSAIHLTETVVFASERLENVFHDCFLLAENTRLVGGAEEPLYQPAQAAGEACLLYYREDFFASALHEIAHWCIAGQARRRQLDFGYWYAPEGRNPVQQRAFEAVEVQPQALEWYFSQACGYQFRVSVDNLDPGSGKLPDTLDFRRQVAAQARHWQREGLPRRAGVFYTALTVEFNTGLDIADLEFAEDLID